MKSAREKGVIPEALCKHIVEICEEEWRECDICNASMTEGYYVEQYDEYFCSDDCLHSVYSNEEYTEMFNNDDAYWTQWF